jgi:hypothetical protein
VTELSASTGRQLAVLASARQPFGQVLQMIDDGHDVWILGLTSQSFQQQAVLTELDDATGVIVQRFLLPVDRVNNAGGGWQPAFALSDGRLWVYSAPNAVTAYSAVNGALLHVFVCTKIGLNGGIFGVTSDSGHVFVAGLGRLAELSSRTGHLLHVYAGPSYGPFGYGFVQWSAGGGHLWAESDSPRAPQSTVLTEYSEATGREVRAITQQDLGLSFFSTMGVFEGNLWISADTATTYEDAVL